MPSSDYHPAYYEGIEAAEMGYSHEACPYTMVHAPQDNLQYNRSQSDMCKRHWWLAGHYDQKRGASDVQ